MALLKYASNVICELGTNDINTSRTLAQIQSDLQTIWQAAKAAGVRRVAQTLIIPRTTSTDSWATAANQTPVSGFATGSTRDQLNAWIKAQVGQGLLDGYIDPNPQVEDQANLGKWQTNGTASFATTDGTHPTAAFQASMATVVTNYIPNLV
jgi:lysophospholipase L1-like esterase